MDIRSGIGLAVVVLALGAAGAAEAGTLKPASRTAIAITGPVQLSPLQITFGNGASLRLALVRQDAPFKDDIEGGVKASIYKVIAPKDPVLLNGNRLCGGAKPMPVTYIVTWSAKGDGSVWIAPSSSVVPPAGIDDVCGTYNYTPS